MSRRRQWWARRLGLAAIGAGGLAVIVLAVLAADLGLQVAGLAGLWVFILWVWAIVRFDIDTADWGPW